MRLFLVGFVVFLVWTSCKARVKSDGVLNSTSQDMAGFDEFMISKSQIPKTPSLFDRLIWSKYNPKPGVVPFPFSKLRMLVESREGQVSDANVRNLRSIPVLIPMSRSLQRFSGDPDYFKFPRVILAANTHSTQVGVEPLSGRLFIAYSEPAKQLEVISFNEDMGRFEFQVVTNYGDESTPQVFYANRDACLSCHQGRSPIFPSFPWAETNSTDSLAKALSKTHGSQYHSVLTQQIRSVPDIVDGGDDPDDFETESFNFEILVRSSTGLIEGHAVWKLLHSSLAVDRRSFFLARALAVGIGSFHLLESTSELARLEKVLLREFKDSGQRTLRFFSPFSIFDLSGTDTHVIIDAAQRVSKGSPLPLPEVRAFLANAPTNLKQLESRIVDSNLDNLISSAGAGFLVFKQLGRLLPDEDMRAIIAYAKQSNRSGSVLEKLVSLMTGISELCSNSSACSLNHQSFSRKLFLADVETVTGGAVRPHKDELSLSQEQTSRVKLRLAPHEGLVPSEAVDPGLGLSLTYCGRCHATSENGRELGFLMGTDQPALIEGMRQIRSRALDRMTKNNGDVMPPSGSIEADALKLNQSDRVALETWLKSL